MASKRKAKRRGSAKQTAPETSGQARIVMHAGDLPPREYTWTWAAEKAEATVTKSPPSALGHIRDELVKHRLLAGQLRGRLSDICGAVFGSSAWMAQGKDVSEPTPKGIIPLICAESDDLADTLRDIESLVAQLEGL